MDVLKALCHGFKFEKIVKNIDDLLAFYNGENGNKKGEYGVEQWFPTYCFPGAPSLILKNLGGSPSQLKLQLRRLHCFIP